jgi:ketopantoate hydroxymethyltransferase
MSVPEIALLVSASAYAGFQWTVRVVVYPQMVRVGTADFARYESGHQRAVSRAVAPLFLAIGACCLTVFAVERSTISLLAGLTFATVLALTALGAMPQHRRLSTGFDPEAHRRLLAVDSVRLVLAVVEVGLAVVLLTT